MFVSGMNMYNYTCRLQKKKSLILIKCLIDPHPADHDYSSF